GLGGEDAGAGHERARPAREAPAAARAVGVTLALAQVHVDPAGELAAEDRVEHLQGVVVGIGGAGGTRMPDPDLALCGARLVDEIDAGGTRFGPGRNG